MFMVVASVIATAGTADASPAVADKAGLVYFTTLVTQPSYKLQYADEWNKIGTLYAGSNYFKCWKVGTRMRAFNRSSAIWLLTDDDTGNANVWVPDVNLDDYGFANDTTLLNEC
ncbi:hypothetical protein [Amycolatopsis oliviviridis]|nr:hypothetical protein [Amycolatopsis oliviviridis]